jgi:hypothetical protein
VGDFWIAAELQLSCRCRYTSYIGQSSLVGGCYVEGMLESKVNDVAKLFQSESGPKAELRQKMPKEA